MKKIFKRFLGRSLILGLIAVTLYITTEVTQSLSFVCPDEKAKELLRDLCLMYKNKLVDGNLCSDLCNTGALQYASCYNYHSGKVVFRGTWKGEHVIFKSKYGQLLDYPHPFAIVVDQEGEMRTVVPEPAFFTTMVYHHVRGQFGFDLDLAEEEVLTRMWTSKEDKKADGSYLTDAEIISLWALLQQEEYVVLQFWKGFQHYPEVYGTCGHFYFMEYVPPGFILSPSIFSVSHLLASLPWLNRAKVAMAMLDFIATLDSAFPEKLHLCDVKHDNFGVTQDLLVKAIDVDITFFQNQLDSTLHQQGCKQDTDCDFFDCKGSCNLDIGECSSERTNTNLQAVCEDVFSLHYGTPGLLRMPPTQVASRLDSALQACIQQKGLPVDTKISETAVFQSLMEALKESLKYVDR